MPKIPFLQSLGNFIQETVTTNVAKVLVGNFTDIIRGYKRWRNVACLSVMMLTGGGGVPAFILIPGVKDYFYPIVKQSIPFLGKVGTDIAVGIIGFWICAALGYNVAKFIYREVSLRKNGHTNTEYTITDDNVAEIIDANPVLYFYEKTPDGELTAPAQNKRNGDIQELKQILIAIRGRIDRYKSDSTTRHDDNKVMLLRALRRKDLTPILEDFAKNSAKRELRIDYAAMLANFLSEAEPQAFINANQNNHHQEELNYENIEMESIVPGQNNLRESRNVFSNTVTRLKELLISGKIYPLHHSTNTRRPLDAYEKHGVIRSAGSLIRKETAKGEEDRTRVPGGDRARQLLRLV